MVICHFLAASFAAMVLHLLSEHKYTSQQKGNTSLLLFCARCAPKGAPQAHATVHLHAYNYFVDTHILANLEQFVNNKIIADTLQNCCNMI